MSKNKKNSLIDKALDRYYSFRYKKNDPDFKWFKKYAYAITQENKVICVVVGYGWGCCDVLIPVMEYLKEHTQATIITLLPYDNAGEQRRVDRERWNNIYRYSDAVLLNDAITHRPFREMKYPIKKRKKRELYFSSLEKYLFGIEIDAVLVCDEFEARSCAWWLKTYRPDAVSCGIDPCTYTDIEENYNHLFSEATESVRSLDYDYYCMSARQRITTIPQQYLEKFIYTGSPRADTWYLEKLRYDADQEKKRLLSDDKKRAIVGLVFPNLYYPERFYEGMRITLKNALLELVGDDVILLLKFHPRNDIGIVKRFIRSYIPLGTLYKIVDYSNTKLSFISDVVVNIGISDSRPDLAVSRRFFIEYCDDKCIAMHCEEHGFPREIDGNRGFWQDHGMSVMASDKDSLVYAIRKELSDPSTGADYDSIFPKSRNASKTISDYLMTGTWDDEVFIYGKDTGK